MKLSNSIRSDLMSFAMGAVCAAAFGRRGFISLTATNVVAAGVFCAINSRCVDWVYSNLGGNPGRINFKVAILSQLLIGATAYGWAFVAVKAGLIAAAAINPASAAVVLGLATFHTLARYYDMHRAHQRQALLEAV